ncbi:Hypothetical protein, putative, partial [Bodo saltans]
GSDRARIAVLKSDIGLVQVEIDAFRGDPGGLLELQSVLERFQWNPDAHLNGTTKEQLNVILLRKLNELAVVCQAKVFANVASQKNIFPLLPQNSLVSDVVNFFQLKRLQPGKSASAVQRAPSESGQSQQSSLRPSGAVASGNERDRASIVPSPASVLSPTSPPPSFMVAADPDDDIVAPMHESRRESVRPEQVIVVKHSVTPVLPPSEHNISRTPPSPIEGLSEEESEEDEDGISWGPAKPAKKQRRSSIKKKMEATVVNTNANLPGIVPMDDVAKLKRQLERAKMQIKFFKSLERHILYVQNVSDHLQLMAASPAVEQLPASLKEAVEHFFPQGLPIVTAATNAVNAAASAKQVSSASPGKKGAKPVVESVCEATPATSAAILANILNSGPPDEKKLKIALAFQNSVIEILTTNSSVKAQEDEATIRDLNSKVDALQSRLSAQHDAATRERTSSNLQLERVGNALRLQTPSGSIPASNLSLSAWLQPASNLGGLPSRPLSRTSVAEGGGLLGFPMSLTPPPGRTQQLLTLPPRPDSGFSTVDVGDHADTVFGNSASSLAGPVRKRNNLPLGRGRPLVATRPDDVEGESERRYLQVIRSQSEIIKELSAKAGTTRTAASSVTALAAFNNSS